MLTEELTLTIDCWRGWLDQYSHSRLCTPPAPGSWSLGQLYLHLINDTRFFLRQAEKCLASRDPALLEASPEGRRMLANNAFPDIAIQGAASHALIPQPENAELLKTGLLELKMELQQIPDTGLSSAEGGKSRHPGLGYFNAAEWLQFAQMHFRHHERQKSRIDQFLNAHKI